MTPCRVPLWFLGIATMAWAATPDGADLYSKNCAICHETLAVIQNHVALKSMPAEYIVRVLTTGAMRTQAASLSGDERVAIATYLSGEAPAGPRDPSIGRCSSNAPAAT